jgi:hypothetical protein
MNTVLDGIVNTQILVEFNVSGNTVVNIYTNSVSNAGIFLSGNNAELNTTFQNNNFSASLNLLDPGVPTLPGSQMFQIMDVLYLQFSGNYANNRLTTGLYYGNIGNYPCSVLSEFQLKVLNLQTFGNRHDFFCQANCPGILCFTQGCAGLSCFNNVNFAVQYCIVDKLVTPFTPNFAIIYFTSIQLAIDLCQAPSPRRIYITNDVYEEQLTIHNRYTSEILELQPLTPNNATVLIIGKNQAITSIVGTTTFILNLTSLWFLNPTGLSSFTSNVDNYILTHTFSTVLTDLIIDKSKFFALQPITGISIPPLNINLWIPILNDFTNGIFGSIHPSIRMPNTATIINTYTSRSIIITNTQFYGSILSGITDLKIGVISSSSVILTNVYGENQWNQFVTVSGASINNIQNLNCSYFCGGINGTNVVTSVIKIIPSPISTILFIYNSTVRNLVNPIGNPYFGSQRFLVGNPFFNNLLTPIGYLTSLWLINVNSPYPNIKIRNNIFIDYPVAVRLTNINDTNFITNEDTIPFFYDNRRAMRELQRWNYVSNPISAIAGTIYDLRKGTAQQDQVTLVESFICNDLCIPNIVGQCYVGILLIPSPTQFNSLKDAINFCPLNLIIIVDTVLVESITGDFLYTQRNPLPTDTMVITSISGSIVVGKHSFSQSCPGVGYNVPLTGIIFQNVDFQYTPLTPNEKMFEIIGNGCGFEKLGFKSCNFIFNMTTTSGNVMFSCSQCLLNQLYFDGTQWNSPSTYSWRGILLDTSLSVMPPIVNITTSTVSVASQFAYLNFPKGFNIRSNNIECLEKIPFTEACILINGGITLPVEENSVTSNTIVISNGTNIGFQWNLKNNYDLPQIENITDGINDNTINTIGVDIGIKITTPNMNSILCGNVNVDNRRFIRALANDNPLVVGQTFSILWTDESNIIYNQLVGNSTTLNCFFCNDQCTQFPPTNAMTWFIIISIIILLSYF